MKTIYFWILLVLINLINACTGNRGNNPILKGSYLGQKKPGMLPEMFAPGFISTGLYITNDWENNTLNYSQVINYIIKPGHGRADVYWISSSIVDEFRTK